MLQKLPEASKYELEFKSDFITRYLKLTDFEKFKENSLSYLRRSIRINTLKASVAKVKKSLGKEWILEQIPWCKNGFWISHKKGERFDIGNTIEHSLGYIYVQEAASMIPALVLDPKPGEVVLDMCAAPGSKTTQLGELMKNKGVLVANDIKGDRLAALGINIQRVGMINTIATQARGQYFSEFKFDKILVDAPCSGTGTISKSLKTIKMWNPNMVKRLSMTQKSLITNAFQNLKAGGTMVYSTCTLEPEEDEEVIDYLLKKFSNAKLEKIDLDIKRSEPVLGFEGKVYDKSIEKCLRIWPQDNNTEGFFVAKIRKLEL